jgi:hypothetical protein
VSTTFRIHNSDVACPERVCATFLSKAEEDALLDDGIVVPRQCLDPSAMAALRDAVDALAAVRFRSAEEKTYHTGFAGQYIREPHLLDPRILTLPLLDLPLADTLRTLLGPRIVLRNSSIRITQPGSSDSTIWHTDYRPHITPPPRLQHAPAVVTVLIYLDAADDQTGALFAIPGSQCCPQQPAAANADLPSQVSVNPVPGQLVLMNAATWHRGGPNVSPSQVRRLITLQLSSVLMGRFNFEHVQPSPAYQRLASQAATNQDEPLLELLGLGGVNPASSRY